jgi:hypothetical protein
MKEVFINYRTGDGDEAAALIEQYLSQRFGEEHIFKASRSIQPGEAYAPALVSAARHSLVLLAVMGPDWMGAPQLRDADDWVRREILEARGSAVTVIPVLKGRKTDRLDPAELPSDLAWLADVQSLRLDTKNQADLETIASTVADLVPGLKAVHSTDGTFPGTTRGVANSANSVTGPLAQTGQVTGNLNFFGGNRGTVHTGTGDIYPDPRPRPEEDDQ